MKALKVKLSGSYRKAKREIVDFEGIEGIVPFCDPDVAYMHIRKRYVPMWIAGKKEFTDRLSSVREVHVDEMEEIEHSFSYVGKDIKEMTFEELQDLATAFDLREIPLWKKTSLVHTRTIAYAAYSKKVLNAEVDYQGEGFSLANVPSVVVKEGNRREKTGKVTNEDIINAEMSSPSVPKHTMDLDDLKKIADQRGIEYHPNIGFDKLYERLYAA